MSIGVWQVVIILVIVLIIFGAGKLPNVMGDVAKGIKSFKAGMAEDEATGDGSAKRTIDHEAGTAKADDAISTEDRKT